MYDFKVDTDDHGEITVRVDGYDFGHPGGEYEPPEGFSADYTCTDGYGNDVTGDISARDDEHIIDEILSRAREDHDNYLIDKYEMEHNW